MKARFLYCLGVGLALSSVGWAEESFPILDVHTHTSSAPESQVGLTALGEPASLSTFYSTMAKQGVVGAVSHTSTTGGGYANLKHRNIIHCRGIAPDTSVELVEQGLKNGMYSCLKVYLGYVYAWAYDPAYHPFYRLAARYGVPVVFHTGDTQDKNGLVKYTDPLTLDEVAVQFRSTTFVIAHAGNPWIQSAAEVAYKNYNVYIEASALLIGDLTQEPKEKVRQYVVEPIRWIFGYLEDPTKLMFATDWPLVDVGSYIEAYKEAIPPEHWRAVFYDNARRVFRFPK